MALNTPTMISKAFGEHADRDLVVSYQSHQEALRYLNNEIAQANGIALLQGPKGSGKTTIIREQRRWFARRAAVVVINGVHLTPKRLVSDALSQLGAVTVAQDDQLLLQQLNNHIGQLARAGSPPIMVIDNIDRATSSALRLFDWLAAQETKGRYALRLVLTGRDELTTLVRSDALRNIARRKPTRYTLNPLSTQETMTYLRTRMIASGVEHAEKAFSIDDCDRIRTESEGWPGLINAAAVQHLQGKVAGAELPAPRIVVSRDGKTVGEYELSQTQYVIGRTELADIVISDTYVSKMHAMLQVYRNAIVLIDLNSTNGTTVNSRVVQKTVLKSNDVISLGHFRLKIENAPAMTAEISKRVEASDTITMASLDDIRRQRAKRTIKVLKQR